MPSRYSRAMPHDEDEPITIDTRKSSGRARLPRRPAEEPREIPVRPEHQGTERPTAPRPDSTRVMPAGRRDNSTAGPVAPRGPAGPPRRRKRKWPRVLLVIVLVIALWIALLIWAGLSAWGQVKKVDAFPDGDRPAGGKGTNVLLVGSDSRAGLSAAQGKELGTGGSSVSEGSQRTDSIMVLHMPDSGKPTLVSFPRDSWVPIPGHGAGKINSSFAIGGPKLLTKTIEQASGLHIDNYMEIGFGGFAGVVDSVGGVRMCLKQNVDDKNAHINLKKGCQNLSGRNALGYVRSRDAFATGDLARAEHQREFLGALTKKIASPGNVLLPWKLKSVGSAGAKGVTVNKGMSPIRALKILWTLKGISNGGISIQVPVANPNYRVAGQSAVLWDKTRAKQLFDDLNNDRAVTAPQTGS